MHLVQALALGTRGYQNARVRDVGKPLDLDVTFDMRSDTPKGKDPDSHSPTLREYHRLLWSKVLPNGARFDLSASRPGAYLYHSSDLGNFFLTSDAAIRTFRSVRRAASVIEQIPEGEREAFSRRGYTIGGMMLFPVNRIAGMQTINQRRGTHPKISDRLDLTLECIRRHYLDEHSPLGETLTRYGDFFELFGDFAGYVDYFLLHDLVTDDFQNVRFLTTFADFTTPAIPQTLEEYQSYRRQKLEFVAARNGRIATQTY